MKKMIACTLLCIVAETAVACTTFVIDKEGHIVFGRNYDWISGAGIVHTNQRGLFKTSIKNNDGQTLSWVSKFGSITFNQYGKEFPTGGMNEDGLVVELMWLDGARYPENDARSAVGVLQWIQYQLDNFSTTEEVINSDALLRIESKSVPLHYLVADASGSVASIEFLGGKMVVHKGRELPFPVLTNSTYASSAEAENKYLKRNDGVLPGDNSLDRFVTACNMIQQFNAKNINTTVTDFAFSILDKVSQGDYTKWSIVYDITNKEIHFKTRGNSNIKIIRFKGFDFSCTSPAKMYNMNQQDTGDITANFILPNKELKRNVIARAVTESSKYVTISDEEKERMLIYEEEIKCK
ncbi:MAG TPA: linear amide C-N hydrolase [Chitinophagaceae bacterium]